LEKGGRDEGGGDISFKSFGGKRRPVRSTGDYPHSARKKREESRTVSTSYFFREREGERKRRKDVIESY